MAVYFAQSLEGGPIKIGCSDNVPARIRALEAHYDQPLAVLATIPGGREVEKAVHKRFAHARLGKSEQFRPVAEIMTFIDRPLLVCADPQAVERMPATTAFLHHRCTPTWLAWLNDYAAAKRRPVMDLIAEAMEIKARLDGHPLPPER